MAEEKYSQKEIAVYHGVLKLIREGAAIPALKAADIAKAAGIGKGTLYNYFESKEEILARTVLYTLENQLQSSFDEVKQADGFQKKCEVLFGLLLSAECSRESAVYLLMTGMGRETLDYLLGGRENLLDASRAAVRRQLTELLQLGMEEGILRREEDLEYALYVLYGVLMGLKDPTRSISEPDTSAEVKLKYAWRLLISALGEKSE